MVDFFRRLLGMPTTLPNGYPNMAANHQYEDVDGNLITEVGRRINGGGYYFPPPPPPIPQNRVVPEKPDPPMIPKIIDKISKESPRQHPSGTSSINSHNMHHWCGSTFNEISKEIGNEDQKDPLILDKTPLRHFLMKIFPWILDVTEVRIRPRSSVGNYNRSDIVYGPLEIHITVSPIHHSELMVPSIEKKIRERLYLDLIPLISSIHVNNRDDKPIIIFSPSHSETILEYVE